MFNELSFQPEDTSSAYDRALFEHWIDANGNGCDTRQEVLISESQVPVTYGSGCTITAGKWYSYYDGATWTNPSDVDIDHLVPLEEAWGSGAYRWTPELRKAYANDLDWSRSLVAVTDNVNQSKGSQDPSTWLPGDGSIDPKNCDYAIDWITVKWRWNLTADNAERDVLSSIVNGTSCGAIVIGRPAKMNTYVDTFTGWPLYKIVYDSTIYELVTQQDGITQIPVPLSYDRWANYYKFKQPTPAATDFVKYPWSPTVYAVTFWPGGENYWQWTRLTFEQWNRAGQPFPRIAGWIKGSYYYQWGSNYSEIFVEGEDGINHKLTLKEWEDSGRRPFQQRNSEGFYALYWAPELARMTDVYTGAGRPLGYAEWQEEGFPTPQRTQRIKGDQFYQDYGNPTVYYAGPGMNRAVTFQEWQAAGSPIPTVRNAPAPGTGTGGDTSSGGSGGTSYTWGVTPGAYCSTAGALGYSSTGTLYTCKTSYTDSRLRWRQ
ncbi:MULTISPECIES: HNH endonuclease family protein [unclassified Arthrobacter]|uniref:HNH endonuclease family protein n=1 Tax=unclassified Arthrobacter TaxID=235627 RepID=UPI001C85A0CA|nr:HNH endonuclease family protein [Arthrobacter sp. MAHUQ-56]MBX7445463.1 HNH endonuclease family protein [Arthrobacter sp. MAHUQ-56]